MNNVYISQFRIGRQEVLKQRLCSAYDLHRLLWRCFPDRPEAQRDFLFRCDEAGAELKILMLSREKPVQSAWAGWDGVKEFAPDFQAGSWFQFRLRSNPTVRANQGGKLRALTGEDELAGWLERKGARHGFELRSEPEFAACRLTQFTKSNDGRAVSLNVVDASGVLVVADGAAFGEAFCRGVGRGRAFGCGMLLLKRIAI